jgi:hypothetical protein
LLFSGSIYIAKKNDLRMAAGHHKDAAGVIPFGIRFCFFSSAASHDSLHVSIASSGIEGLYLAGGRPFTFSILRAVASTFSFEMK